jgi:hypothetical protein
VSASSTGISEERGSPGKRRRKRPTGRPKGIATKKRGALSQRDKMARVSTLVRAVTTNLRPTPGNAPPQGPTVQTPTLMRCLRERELVVSRIQIAAGFEHGFGPPPPRVRQIVKTHLTVRRKFIVRAIGFCRIAVVNDRGFFLPRPENFLDSALGTFDVKNVLEERMHVQPEETRCRGVRRSPEGD